MKKLYLIFICYIIIFQINAQSPKSFQYQAVVRNSTGQIIQNQAVSFRFNLLQGASNGTSVYEETHNIQTNEFGIVNLKIGEGTVTSGSFDNINWGNYNYFLQIELDENGTSNYQMMGVTQLLSVPYALYSEKSGSTDSSLWNENGNDIYYNKGNVGIGEITPTGKLVVKSDSTALNDDVIFSVLNAQGDTVLAVYQEGVRINVYDNPANKAIGSKGGFAVGGFSPAKGTSTNEYLRVTPDSVRIYVEDAPSNKAIGSKGGFAVGGFSPAKAGLTNEYLRVTSDSTRVYTTDTITGFAAKNISTSGKSSYMQLTPNNYFIGHEAGKNITTGKYNSFIGYQSGFKNTVGYKNYFIGYKSGFKNIEGFSNIFIGDSTGFSNIGGNYNIFLGNQSGFSNTEGVNNIFIGFQAGRDNTSAWNNTAIGKQALYSNTIGSENVAIGYQTLFSNISGVDNIANGVEALYSNTTGNYNIANGVNALYSNTTGSDNIASGILSLYSNTIGTFNIAIGGWSLYSNTEGYWNIGIGSNALKNNITGNGNSSIGEESLKNNTIGNYNTAFGIQSLQSNIDSWFNTAVGERSLYSHITGSSNTAFGGSSLFSDSIGNCNTALGKNAMYNNKSGNYNSAIGYNSFLNNSNYNNSTAIGANSTITASNQIRIGDNTITSIGGYTDWTNISDGRVKKNIKETVHGIDFIMKLRPVNYNLDMDKIAELTNIPDSIRNKESEKIKSEIIQTGFIAQEVEKAANDLGFDFSGVDKPKKPNDNYGLRYAEFTVPLVKAVQEQQTIIDELKSKNVNIENELQTSQQPPSKKVA